MHLLTKEARRLVCGFCNIENPTWIGAHVVGLNQTFMRMRMRTAPGRYDGEDLFAQAGCYDVGHEVTGRIVKAPVESHCRDVAQFMESHEEEIPQGTIGFWVRKTGEVAVATWPGRTVESPVAAIPDVCADPAEKVIRLLVDLP